MDDVKWTHVDEDGWIYGVRSGKVYYKEHPEGELTKSLFTSDELTSLKCFSPITTETQGVKHDSDKPKTNLLPPRALLGVSEVLTYGAKKYAPENWRKFDDIETRYLAAALRHLFAMMQGEEVDDESGLPHVDHALASLMFVSESMKMGEES